MGGSGQRRLVEKHDLGDVNNQVSSSCGADIAGWPLSRSLQSAGKSVSLRACFSPNR